MSYNQIAICLKIGLSTAHSYIKLAQEAGLSWPLPDHLDDASLERLLFKNSLSAKTQAAFLQPDFPAIHRELQRKGVTIQLLWEEYRAADPNRSYSHPQFCHLYRDWRGHLKVTLRQTHRAGEKLFVDYAGQSVAVIGPAAMQPDLNPSYAELAAHYGFAVIPARPPQAPRQGQS